MLSNADSQANILVNDEGEPCIADFGLSRVEAIQTTLTGTSSTKGTFRWQAPELVFPDEFGGNGKHTAASDIYAFGMTCLEVKHTFDMIFLPSDYFFRSTRGQFHISV